MQPWNALSSILEDDIVTEVKPVQPPNAWVPILVTVDGIVTEVKLVQPSNAAAPILVTPTGIFTEVKLVQPWNALSSILEDDIVAEVKPVQP